MKINYIDNGDSFAHIIAEYFSINGADVKMYRSDCSLETAVSGKLDMILLGPGPNGPREAGNYMELLEKYRRKIPFFGICLGFQAIMEYFGQPVVPLDDVVHGKSVPVTHNGKGIFEGIEQDAHFARYNSLGVYLHRRKCYSIENGLRGFEVTAVSNGTITNEKIIMAAAHESLPVQGIQFHPDSVLSMRNDNGMRLIQNVLKVYKEIKK